MSTKVKVTGIQLIHNLFDQYAHSETVLKRAVRNCKHPDVIEFLKKTLEEEPRWENEYNIIWAIVFNKKLMNCKFCNKALPFKNILANDPYCSESCRKTDKQLKVDTKEVEKTEEKVGFFTKIKNFFRRKKK